MQNIFTPISNYLPFIEYFSFEKRLKNAIEKLHAQLNWYWYLF